MFAERALGWSSSTARDAGKVDETMAAVLFTQAMIAKIEKLWSEYAGEAVECFDDMVGQVVGVDAICVWGSELACLRLHYRLGSNGLVAKSHDGRWYFRSKK